MKDMKHMTSEQRAEGARNAAGKPYTCPTCNHVGFGNRMVSEHLNGCKGPGRKLREQREKNEPYREEGEVNTRLWQVEKLQTEMNKQVRGIKRAMISDIDNMTEINAEFMEEMITAYYARIF